MGEVTNCCEDIVEKTLLRGHCCEELVVRALLRGYCGDNYCGVVEVHRRLIVGRCKRRWGVKNTNAKPAIDIGLWYF